MNYSEYTKNNNVMCIIPLLLFLLSISSVNRNNLFILYPACHKLLGGMSCWYLMI